MSEKMYLQSSEDETLICVSPFKLYSGCGSSIYFSRADVISVLLWLGAKAYVLWKWHAGAKDVSCRIP